VRWILNETDLGHKLGDNRHNSHLPNYVPPPPAWDFEYISSPILKLPRLRFVAVYVVGDVRRVESCEGFAERLREIEKVVGPGGLEVRGIWNGRVEEFDVTHFTG
jgi:hypothetical protein